jgi:hypothetical protein
VRWLGYIQASRIHLHHIYTMFSILSASALNQNLSEDTVR